MIDLSQVSPLNFPGRQFGDLPDIIFRADEKNAKKAKYYVSGHKFLKNVDICILV